MCVIKVKALNEPSKNECGEGVTVGFASGIKSEPNLDCARRYKPSEIDEGEACFFECKVAKCVVCICRVYVT